MAQAELAKGSERRLKALARNIIAAQKKEIAEMEGWRKSWYGSTSPASSMHGADDAHMNMDGQGMHGGSPGESMDMGDHGMHGSP